MKKKYSKRFKVFGYFYKVGENKFRKQLEIIRIQEIEVTEPDLIVVMMNPGSSKQKLGYENTYDILVPTKHDMTQTKIMQYMDAKKYNYVRALNLSDYCEPKSNLFYEILSEPNQFHSIFSVTRDLDLKELFHPNIPVLLAWGVDSQLNDLALQAYKKIALLKPEKIIGLKKEGCEFGYYHPMRRKSKEHILNWLEEILTD